MPSRSTTPTPSDSTPVQNDRRRSTSAMLPPTTEGEPTQCQAKATGAGASLALIQADVDKETGDEMDLFLMKAKAGHAHRAAAHWLRSDFAA